MLRRHLGLLCDPISREDLRLEIFVEIGEDVVEGLLHSSRSSYPITNGIPRFVRDEGYSENFGRQWERWALVQYEDENVGGPMQGWTTSMFRKITGWEPSDLQDRRVLEIGCGGGRFGDLVQESNPLTYIGLDYSRAVDVAKKLMEGKGREALFLQADALAIPLKSDSIDLAYSIGVLHHTPDPSLGIFESFRCLRSGGSMSLSVYERGGYYGWPNVVFWRKLFNSMTPKVKQRAALIYSKLLCTLLHPIGRVWRPLTYPVRLIFPTVYLPDLRWSILDTFDSLTTSYQSTHTGEEVASWMSSHGFRDVRQQSWGSTSWTGVKP